MRCDDFLPLIEKLVDGEAAAAERQQAEAHLESCTSCQSHFRFLKALPEAARQASLPDPPDMYWEVLPRKIMSRIEKEGATRRRGWFSQILAPSRLRWAGALAAALVAAVVGLRVLQSPLTYRDAPPSASVARSNEEKREAVISRRDAPAPPAQKEEVMDEKPAAESADSLTPARRQASEEGAAQEDLEKPKELVALDDNFEQAARKRVA
ncbi:MAG: zf-HC2 domain-containing protein, partial [Vicinamibacteria bacterium]